MISNTTIDYDEAEKKINKIFWVTVCAIAWIILLLMCISNIWTHFRKVFCKNNEPELVVRNPNWPHLVHSTEHFPMTSEAPLPMEKTCISAPRSKSNKPLMPKETTVKKPQSQPLSDQLERIPVMTPLDKTDETVDTQTGPIKIPGVKKI